MAGSLFANWKTIPNLLSALRIVMVPIFIILFYKDYLGWAVFVLFLSGLSDSLDGKIARRFNQISELGKMLDPLADKFTQIAIAVMLFIFFRSSSVTEMVWFSWIFIVFLAKEALMVIISFIMLGLGLRPSAAEIYGKTATFFFYGVMLLIIGFGPEIGAFSEHFTLPTLIMQILVVVSALLTMVAFFSYVPDTLRQFKERSAKNKGVGINKRSVGLAILLSIITLGIYTIYWQYLLVKNIRAIKHDTTSCTGEMLCLIFVPFYSLYWWFTRGEAVKQEFSKRNYAVLSNGTVLLVLSLFGLGIVAIAILQNDFNSLPSST